MMDPLKLKILKFQTKNIVGYKMDKYEAGMDSVQEVFVQFPNSPTRELHTIAIMDQFGIDLTVEQVRINLLENNGDKKVFYQLAFRNETSKQTINVSQAARITEYMKYLTDPNFTIIFVPQ